MSDEPIPILETTPAALGAWLAEEGQPAYRRGQVLRWVYGRFAASFDEMDDLPKTLREALRGRFSMGEMREAARLVSADGRTEKFAFELADGARVESVTMGGGRRPTFCISSQVGCAMGCKFCATADMGLRRNLRAGEILGQVVALARAACGTGNIVFMGMGEPLANLGAVVPALEALTDEERFSIGERRITVSTAGLVTGIRKLAAAPVHPNLALSLNSPYDAQRAALMPITERNPLDDVLRACAAYSEKTGRQILLEYVLLGGVNTSTEAACDVVRIARRLKAKVNLIEYNSCTGKDFRLPTRGETHRFRSLLEDRGVTVTQRFRRGRDIAAGCGQLAGDGTS